MDEEKLRDWESGLFDCFENVSTCCYGFWCCPCLACTVSNRFGEHYCLPLCDIFSPALFAAFEIPILIPPASLAMRSAMRKKYGIKGSICKDIAATCCCLWCSWCQMHREVSKKDKKVVVVNVQAPQVVNMQPAPVMMMPMITPQVQNVVINTS